MNKQRRQLHKHIEKRGNHLVKVTPQLISYWWKVCNDAVFDGMLNYPSKFVSRPMRDYGTCIVDRVVEIDGWNSDVTIIEVASNTPVTRKLFLSVLIHEMVHQWEYQLGPGRDNLAHAGHGKHFKRMARKSGRRAGLKISVEFYEEDYVTDGQKELHKRRYKGSKRSRSR